MHTLHVKAVSSGRGFMKSSLDHIIVLFESCRIWYAGWGNSEVHKMMAEKMPLNGFVFQIISHTLEHKFKKDDLNRPTEYTLKKLSKIFWAM